MLHLVGLSTHSSNSIYIKVCYGPYISWFIENGPQKSYIAPSIICDLCGLIIDTWLKELCIFSGTYKPPKYVLVRPKPQCCFNDILHTYLSGALKHWITYNSFTFQAASAFRNFMPVHTKIHFHNCRSTWQLVLNKAILKHTFKSMAISYAVPSTYTP